MVDILHKIVRRLFRKPKFKYLLVVTKTLDGVHLNYWARIPVDFEILPSNGSEIEAHLAHLPVEHRPDIERRIQRGDLCCVGKCNEQIIYASWMAFRTCYSYALDREYELAPGAVYTYGAYTLPAFRGRGIHPAGTCYRLQLLKEWGYKRDIIFLAYFPHISNRIESKGYLADGHAQVVWGMRGMG